ARRLTKPMVAASVAVVLMLLGGTYFTTRRLVTPAKAHETVPVLVTDFDNRTGETAFDGAAEQTLAIALEDASYVTVFKTTDARAIASELAPGKGGRITRDIGQLIARRDERVCARTGAADRRQVHGSASGVPARRRPRSAVRPGVRGHRRRVRKLLQAARQGGSQLPDGDAASGPHDRAGEVSNARQILSGRRWKLREGDRDLRDTREAVSGRRQRARRPRAGVRPLG